MCVCVFLQWKVNYDIYILLYKSSFRPSPEGARYDQILVLGPIRLLASSINVLQQDNNDFDKKRVIKSSLGVTRK